MWAGYDLGALNLDHSVEGLVQRALAADNAGLVLNIGGGGLHRLRRVDTEQDVVASCILVLGVRWEREGTQLTSLWSRTSSS
jgi:hypothetical protein